MWALQDGYGCVCRLALGLNKFIVVILFLVFLLFLALHRTVILSLHICRVIRYGPDTKLSLGYGCRVKPASAIACASDGTITSSM